MNLPNRLTFGRLVLTVIFLCAVFWRARYNDTIALLIFSAASLTVRAWAAGSVILCRFNSTSSAWAVFESAVASLFCSSARIRSDSDHATGL